jgi:hypothetical protein
VPLERSDTSVGARRVWARADNNRKPLSLWVLSTSQVRGAVTAKSASTEWTNASDNTDPSDADRVQRRIEQGTEEKVT